MASVPENLRSAFASQAASPPKGDRFIGAFYTQLLSEIDVNNWLVDLFARVLAKREIPDAYLVNLSFRAAQFRTMNGEIPGLNSRQDYPTGLDEPNQWKPFFEALKNNDHLRSQFESDLENRETVTTKYERYIPLRAILGINGLRADPINIVDFGCSKNIGLRGIRSSRPFKPFEDHTPNTRIRESHNSPFTLGGNWIGIDKMDIHESSFDPWFRACAYYPSEIRENGINGFLETVAGVEFHQYDLLSPRIRDKYSNWFNIAHISTLLYQFPQNVRVEILNTAHELLKSSGEGLVVVQDFAKKNPSAAMGLEFNSDWGQHGSYRTMVYPHQAHAPLEWLIWDSGRCSEVAAGEDFEEVNELFTM